MNLARAAGMTWCGCKRGRKVSQCTERRAHVRAVRSMASAVALAVLAGVVWGCRERGPVQPAPSAPDRLQWHAGDSFTFDTWSLDQNGFRLPATRSLTIRRVLQTGTAVQGFGGVTVMLDSIAIPGAPLRLDTLYFYVSKSGDLWQYGLVAALNLRYAPSSSPSAQWNLIAALSLGVNGIWTAGQADTVSNVVGELFDESTYFNAVLDGSSLLFKTQRAELTGPIAFGYYLWLSVSPPLFARIVEPSSSLANGIDRLLSAAQATN